MVVRKRKGAGGKENPKGEVLFKNILYKYYSFGYIVINWIPQYVNQKRNTSYLVSIHKQDTKVMFESKSNIGYDVLCMSTSYRVTPLQM